MFQAVRSGGGEREKGVPQKNRVEGTFRKFMTEHVQTGMMKDGNHTSSTRSYNITRPIKRTRNAIDASNTWMLQMSKDRPAC